MILTSMFLQSLNACRASVITCSTNLTLSSLWTILTFGGGDVNLSTVVMGRLAVDTNFSSLSLMDKGAFLVKDDRVLKGPLGRSLCSFVRTAHSAHSFRSASLRFATLALLRYARFARLLRSRARSLTSLTPSWDS